MSFKIWQQRPTENEIEETIWQFMHFISHAEFNKAFEICPTYKNQNAPTKLRGKGWLPDSKDAAHVKMITDDLFETLKAYGYLDNMSENQTIPQKDSLKTWCFHITSPVKDNLNQLGLSFPETTGDVEANTFIDGQVSDITSIFSLVDLGYGWVLAFKMFKVM